MPTATFLAEVQNGRILTEELLTAFEGQQVVVTLTSAAAPRAAEEAELLEDSGRIRVPRREVTEVRISVVDVGRRSMPANAPEEEG